MHFKRMTRKSLLFLLPLCWLWSESARAELRTATLRHDSMVYRQANEASQILGKLREGKTVKIYYPDRNGWYAVSFAQPIQGARYGWVHAEDIDVGDAPTSGGYAAGGSTTGRGGYQRNTGFRLKKNWLDLGLDLRQTSPGTFQDTIGEKQASFFVKSFSLEYGRHLNPRIGLAIRGFYYSWSNPNERKDATTGEVVEGNYGASGYGATVGLDFLLVNTSGLLISLGAGGGVSLNQAQNSAIVSGLEDGYLTTNILATPFYGELNVRKFFGTSPVGASLGLGYQVMTLNDVPVLLPGATSNDPAGAANISVGGVFVHVGLMIQM